MNTRNLRMLLAWVVGSLAVAGVLALLGSQGGGAIARAYGADAYSTYYVAPTGSNCGGETPCYTNVQEAIDAADDASDVIKIAAGVYSNVNSYGGLAQVAYISKSLTIRGGYTTSDWSSSDPANYTTTLDAHGVGRVVYISRSVTVSLESLHLTGGDAAGLGGNFFDNAGGGVYIFDASVTLSRCTIADNVVPDDLLSDGWGGGLYADRSTLALYNSRLLNNRATSSGGFFGGNGIGGGLCAIESQVTLEKNVIRENQAFGEWGSGGGVELDGCTFTMVNNVVADNQAEGSGSGINLNHASGISSTGHLYHTTIARNRSTGVAGVRVAGGSVVTLSNTILVDHDTGINVSFGSTATLTATLWGSGSWSNDADWGDVGGIFTGTINIWGLPAFADPDVGDYHILFSSAATDKGVDAGVTTDLDGSARDASPDLGAYEAIGGGLVEVTKAASAELLNPGETVTYTVAITSAGSISLTHVSVTDTLPNRQRPLAAAADSGTCTIADPGYGGQVSCSIGTLEMGRAARVTITAQGDAVPAPTLPHVMRNTVQVRSDQATGSAYADTILQNCHARVNGALPEHATVQAAVDAAGMGDAIWIAGTCVGAFERDGLAQQAHITKSLTLRGGYSSDFSTWNPEVYTTTLDAGGQGRVLYVAGGVDVAVEDLTLTGGDASGLGGGAITGDDAGGGVFAITATLTLSRVRVISNVASATGYGFGGGVSAVSATLRLVDTTVAHNTACDDSFSSGWGGGLSGEFSAVRLEKSRLESNTAGGLIGLGGGATILDGVLEAQATLWLSNTVSGTGWGDGGGLAVEGYATIALTNCVVADNRADLGGSGLWIDGASGELLHPTIARNRGGAGTEVNSAFGGGITLTNAIVVSHSVGLLASEGTTVTVIGVLWHDNVTNTVSVTATLEVSHAITGTPVFSADGYHLTSSSTAIDRGVPAGLGLDIDGDVRDSLPDLGADELVKRGVYLPLILRNN